MSAQIGLPQFLGRIEIKTADKIERVYFEIDENNIEQWEKPQIRESKKAFFYVTITEGGDKEKLECFVDFCEDAIFEMQHADSLIRDGVRFDRGTLLHWMFRSKELLQFLAVGSL